MNCFPCGSRALRPRLVCPKVGRRGVRQRESFAAASRQVRCGVSLRLPAGRHLLPARIAHTRAVRTSRARARNAPAVAEPPGRDISSEQ